MKPKRKTVLDETKRIQRQLFFAAAGLPEGKLRKLLVDTIALIQVFLDCQSPK